MNDVFDCMLVIVSCVRKKETDSIQHNLDVWERPFKLITRHLKQICKYLNLICQQIHLEILMHLITREKPPPIIFDKRGIFSPRTFS